MSRLQIPAQATRAVLLIRHTMAVSEGPDRDRAITPEGADLCVKVCPFYSSVLTELEERFGPAQRWTSEFVRALLTMWAIFAPIHIRRSTLLNNVASITKINGGSWYDDQDAAEVPITQMIRMVIADPQLRRDQPFDEGRDAYCNFIRSSVQNPTGPRLVIAVGHEPHISFAAEGLLAHEQLGFNECDGVVFYLDDHSSFIGAEKLTPA